MAAALDMVDTRLRLQFFHADVVCFAMEQAGIPIVRDLRVFNDGDEPLVSAQLGFQLLPDLGAEQRLDLPALAGGARHELARPNLRLEPGRLRKLIERERAQLRVRVYRSDQCLLEEVRDVEVLAYNEWPGQRAPLGVLVTFITPNQVALLQLQSDVMSQLSAETGSDAIDGYQSRSKDRVLRFVRGAFDCLSRAGVSYATLPASFEQAGQKIRLVETVLSEHLANCLDASLLLASLLERFGLRPLVLLLQDHALVAVWLVEDHFPEGVVEDSARLRTLMDLGHIVALETTVALGPTSSANAFELAVAAARERLSSDAPFVAALDVHVLRGDGFRPLSFRELDGQSGSLPAELDSLDVEAARRLLARTVQAASDSPQDQPGPQPTTSPASRRFQKWKDGLLDLTLRNKLLNFRPNRRSALMLEVPDLDQFEDLLASDRTFEIVPRLASDADDVRSRELVATRHATLAIKERLLKELASGHLHSPHSPDELENRAVFLERTAKTDLEEGGASTLYIAIGLLRWFETSTSDEPKLTPLLLYPVALRFDRQKRRITLRRLEEDPAPNQTLIEKMRRDYKVELTKLAALASDDSGVDVPAMLRVVREAIQHMPRWEVLEDAHLGHFTFSKFLMWKDLHENESDLLTSRIVQHIAEHDLASPLAAPAQAQPEELDDQIAPSELPCVLSADSTQMLAVHAALGGTGLVLQGPPGTGKSQTITNLIAAALSRGQSVLFVSEKMAALEVVYRRLRDVGLEDFCLELHSHKTTRKQVVESFARALQSPLPADESARWTRSSAALTELKQRLNAYVRALHVPTALGKSVYEVLNRQLELNMLPEVALPVSDPLGLSAERYAELRAAVHAFALSARPVSPCSEHPWRWSGRAEWTSALEEELGETVRCLPEALSEVDRAAAELAESLGTQLTGPTLQLTQLVDSGRAVERELQLLCDETAAGPIPRSALNEPSWPRLRTDAHDYTSRLRALKRVETALAARWSEGFHAEDLATLAARFARWADSFFVLAWLCLWGARSRLRKLAKAQLPPNRQILEDLEAARARPATQDALRHSEQALSIELADVWSGAADPDALDLVVARGERARLAWQRLHALPGAAHCGDGSAAWTRSLQRVSPQRARLESALTRAAQAEQCFIRITSPTTRPWADEASPEHRSQLAAAAERANHALDRFRDWCMYQRQAKNLTALNIRGLVDAHESGAVTADQLVETWERAVLARWRKAAIDAEPALRDFSEVNHDRLVQDFGSHDSAHEQLAREWIRSRLQERVPRAQTALKNSELDILRREVQKKSRHIPIRKLIQQLPELRARLKPCFLMSPLSVAQYLPAQSEFDVVVFDEASQIETHDAVGAIARGRQVVIVGDSKQLPPTRFFSRGVDSGDDGERDDDDVVELESILDEAKARNIPELTLGWHYRSRHDALIEFSNRRYYDDRLQVFPAARSQVADLGIAWHPVPDGIFYSSASRVHTRTNPEEAKALVAHLVASLLQHQPTTRSFGVVTFSLSQKNLIEELLETARREHPEIERHWAAPEAVFVKNLENVQGDERDEILFSIAYAKNERGKLNHHFGPVSNSGGERRLNVAITRARKQLRVFATLTHDQIDLGKTKALGAENLQAFLRFATERGRQTERQTVAPVLDSALERDIYRVVTEAGYAVHTKIGCGAYRVDLAVEHPEQPGVYALGIECDGPMYHSAKACRDRDRLRSEMLRGLSWKTYRVWSLAWHFRRTREVERLLAAVREACAARSAESQAALAEQEDDRPEAPASQQPMAAEVASAGAATRKPRA